MRVVFVRKWLGVVCGWVWCVVGCGEWLGVVCVCVWGVVLGVCLGCSAWCLSGGGGWVVVWMWVGGWWSGRGVRESQSEEGKEGRKGFKPLLKGGQNPPREHPPPRFGKGFKAVSKKWREGKWENEGRRSVKVCFTK